MKKQKSQKNISRREFLVLSGVSTAALLCGCATNPVTGKRQIMLISEADEITMDQQNAPHQFSADFGAIQDPSLNRYITEIGRQLVLRSDRTEMPYNFRGVNAVYVNAYTFPAGSIAITRGMLLNLNTESELAALIGHEIGHVCARHAASRMSHGLLAALAVAAGTALVGSQSKDYEMLTAGLGMFASGALLARYSRANEREADRLGLKYMTAGAYRAEGMIGLMDVLRNLSKNNPNVIELMFSTHPMSEDRYETAVRDVSGHYQWASSYPEHRERYMDNTAGLRATKDAVELMQTGESEMVSGKLDSAVTYLNEALKLKNDDYAGLLLLARCRLIRGEWAEAERLAEAAKSVYPTEAQCHHLAGIAKLNNKRCEAAYADFQNYGKILPGNPNTTYFKGLSLDCMGRTQDAAEEYIAYLKVVNEGDYAEHARKRLEEWGYI